jgi:hypothetical protein
MASVAFAEKNLTGTVVDADTRAYPDVPAIIRAELNAEQDRDVLVRMQHLAHKKRARQPQISDEEMADYLALAENRENFEQWFKSRGEPEERAPRSVIAWVLGTLAIVALLTTGLIAAIAVSVSGL